MNPLIKRIAKIAFAFLIIGIAGNIALYSFGVSPFNMKLEDIDQSFTSASTNINNMEIDTSSEDIVLLESADDQFHFHLVGKTSNSKKYNYGHQITTDNQTLKFTLRDKNIFHFGIMYNNFRLEVAIPKIKLNKITLDSSSGDIQLSEMESQSLAANSSSGDIHMDHYKGQLQAETSSGNIVLSSINSPMITADSSSGDLKLSDFTGQLKLDTSSGDIILDANEIHDNITFDTSSGDFKLFIHQPPQAIETDLSSSSGDITQIMPNLLFKEPGKQNHKKGILGSEGPLIRGETSSGDITISSSLSP
jgi:lia operon protein LiaG